MEDLYFLTLTCTNKSCTELELIIKMSLYNVGNKKKKKTMTVTLSSFRL